MPTEDSLHRSDDSIDYFSKAHPLREMATRVALRARTKMFGLYSSVMPVSPDITVVDIGVTPDRELADSNFFEQLYPFPSKVTATSIEDASHLEELHPGLRFVRTEGDRLPFDDNEFDVAFSSAVLEHVGDRDQQRRFVEEMTRVSKRFFLTTPNRNFPIELHTFLPFVHWLPQSAHQRVLRWLRMPFWADTANLNLLRPGELVDLFPPGARVTLRKNRTVGLPSNLIVHGTSNGPVS